MREPGRLIGGGRDCDIFEYGPGLVLRRSRHGRSLATEARTMDYVRGHGYPVPAVEDISDDGLSLVMERVDGPSMVDALGRRPWRMSRYADDLAELHRRLHEIDPPDFLPPSPAGEGTALLHLDLHPLNVLMSAAGPVVIDWPNAVIGNPITDVIIAWLLIGVADGEAQGLAAAAVRFGRSQFAKSFVAHFDHDEIAAHVMAAAEWKIRDANLSRTEIAAIRRLALLSSS